MAPNPTTSASSRSTCAAGCRAGGPAVVAVIGVPADKPVVVIAVNEAGRASACRRVPW
jgi:hypothetical protein